MSRTTYSGLFTAIGTTWGSGDGSTTFNVPNLQGRFLLAAGQGQTAYNGGTGTNRVLGQLSNGDPNSGATIAGAETHGLISGELPANIPYNDPGHVHGLQYNGAAVEATGSYALNNGSGSYLFNIAPTTNSALTGITINPSGGGQHNIMNPFAVVNYIIRYQ